MCVYIIVIILLWYNSIKHFKKYIQVSLVLEEFSAPAWTWGKGRNPEGTLSWPFKYVQFLGLSKSSQRNFLRRDGVLGDAGAGSDDKERLLLREVQGVGEMTTEWHTTGTFLPAPPQAITHLTCWGPQREWAGFLCLPTLLYRVPRRRVTPHQLPIHGLWEGRVCVGHCTGGCLPSWNQRCMRV